MSVFIPFPNKGKAKDCSNYHTIALISHLSKVMFKILQASLQQYLNCELPDVQAGFRKGRGTRDQVVNIHQIIYKAREFQKYNTHFCFIDYGKTSDYVDHNKLWETLQEMGIPNHLSWLLRNLYACQDEKELDESLLLNHEKNPKFVSSREEFNLGPETRVIQRGQRKLLT